MKNPFGGITGHLKRRERLRPQKEFIEGLKKRAGFHPEFSKYIEALAKKHYWLKKASLEIATDYLNRHPALINSYFGKITEANEISGYIEIYKEDIRKYTECPGRRGFTIRPTSVRHLFDYHKFPDAERFKEGDFLLSNYHLHEGGYISTINLTTGDFIIDDR